MGAAFLWVPGFGQLIVVGPLAAALVSSLQGAAVGGAAASLLGALIGWGVSKQHILKYQQSVGAGKFLVVYHGSASEVRQANDILKETQASSLQVHPDMDVYEG